MGEDEDGFLIITDIEEINESSDELRGPLDRIKRKGLAVPISLKKFQENTTEFFADVGKIFESIETSFEQFELDEVEITAGITTGGKLSLIGGSVEGSIQGGIKFTFKRNNR